MRCKSCNTPLTFGILPKNEGTGLEEDLCNNCIAKSRSEYSYLSDKQYTQESSESSQGGSYENINSSSYFYDFHDNF